MKDPDNIIPEEEYNPAIMEHNPAGYMKAMHDVEREINEEAVRIQNNRLRRAFSNFAGEMIGCFLVFVVAFILIFLLFFKSRL